MTPVRFASAVALVLLAGCGPSPAPAASSPAQSPQQADAGQDTPAVEPVTPVDYSKPDAWLCRPETKDACEDDVSATAISASGQLTKEHFAPAADPPIDCFYVYPTVSRDASGNSDTIAGPEEKEAARQQVARFGSVCRIFAPVYRQVTLAALREMLGGGQANANRDMAYADVKAAFEHYLSNDNNGRGVVLIGHSQGAGILTRLIASEIDGKPVLDRMVSALLIGTNLQIADPHEGVGSFRNIGLCASDQDLGCAISYSSFRADAPPPADSLFGKADEQGMHAACVNPAMLDKSNGALKAMLPAGPLALEAMAPPGPWTADNQTIDTPFVMLPGFLSAECVNQGGFSYLAVTVKTGPADKRLGAIGGEVIVNGRALPNWGLHLIDMNLAMGNLVDIVKGQAKAYAARETSRKQHPVDDK